VATKLLEKAFAEASKLTEQQQEALAAWILEELTSERRWEKAFASSSDALAQLADEGLVEYREGRTQELDPHRL
jgi:primosomal protein N'